MNAIGHRFLPFAAVAVLATVSAQVAAAEMAAADAKSSTAANDAPIACKTDADCPNLACGPCTAGAPIKESMRDGPSCAINPCLDASSVCNDRHTCEIGPRTRKNPAVWGKP